MKKKVDPYPEKFDQGNWRVYRPVDSRTGKRGTVMEIDNGRTGDGYAHLTNSLPIFGNAPRDHSGVTIKALASAHLIAGAPRLFRMVKAAIKQGRVSRAWRKEADALLRAICDCTLYGQNISSFELKFGKSAK